MKAAFIFDTVIAQKNSDYYGMTLNYDFFKSRYLTIYDSIVVSTRAKNHKKIKGANGYKKLNGENIEVMPIVTYNEIPDALVNKKKILKELNKIIELVDVVIIRMPSVLGTFASEICRKRGKKYIIEMVACAWDGYINHRNFFGKVVAPIMFFKTRKCIKNAPNVLYVTNKFLQKRYPTDGKQCACSDVALNEINNEVIDERILHIKKMNLRQMKFCTVANVGMKYKGHIYMFKAIKYLKRYSYNIKYYLIGNGDDSYLKNEAEKLGIVENIIFVGSLSHAQVFEKLKEMDIYIQPSLQEGLPRALVEAMSLGIPCIGSDVGGIPELLNNNFIFHRKNVDELMSIIVKLTKDHLIDCSRNNFEKSKEFMPQNLNKKRMGFYKKI